MIEPGADQITLLFNKFGDSDILEYRIYGGTSPQPESVIATTSQPFFQLSSELKSDRHYHFRITAINSQGQESGFSNEEDLFVHWFVPGEEIIRNGDFSDGFNHWFWMVHEGAQNTVTVEDEALHIQIHEGGAEAGMLQLVQPGIQLFQGKTYLLEFDGYADAIRSVELEVRKDFEPWTNFSKQGMIALTTRKTHFSHEFVMEDVSELQARIELNVGGSDHDVILDNLSLKLVDTLVPDRAHSLVRTFVLFPNYPNPFNAGTTFRYEIAKKCPVQLLIRNLNGQTICELLNQQQLPGSYMVFWDGRSSEGTELSSGIYLIQMNAGNFKQIRKLTMIK